MADLQRERVAWISREHAIDGLAGKMPVSLDQQLGCGHQATLSIVRLHSMLPRRIQRFFDHGHELALCQRIECEPLEHIAGDERRRSLQRLVDRRYRIADVALELL